MSITTAAETGVQITHTSDAAGNVSAGPHVALGANIVEGGVSFAVWAPDAETLDLTYGDAQVPMQRDDAGIWFTTVLGIGAGLRYKFRIDGGEAVPDPYARSQPEGPHGPSEVVDPAAYKWQDAGWRGLRMPGLIIYELHVGAYSEGGTFDSLIEELDALKALGVTAVELMPVAEFPGTRNWGYDGVDLFAPSRNYGGPAALKRLVDAAHKRGLGVILDVVYNHFGPDGNYLLRYAKDYLTERHATPWGDAVNFDGARSEMVRRFVVDNACFWLTEYHLDGLRLDATFAIVDESSRHILEEVATAARASVAGRDIILIAETYENDARYLRPAAAGGFGFDAVWADDFHHAVRTNSVHDHRGHYADYTGTLDELARTINRGWLFEGQYSPHFGAARGVPADGLEACRFIYAIQTHDQVGNHAFGRRLSHLLGAAPHRVWSALLLLLPTTPMLFMGQEFASSSRFYYFTDHNADLARQVTKGRRLQFVHSAGMSEEQQKEIPDPQSPQTFAESKLHLTEREDGSGVETYMMYKQLLALRKSDPVLSRQDRNAMHAIVCGKDLLLVHLWHGREHRMIAANTGVGIDASPTSLSLPPELTTLSWTPVLCTDDRRFGGSGDQIRFDQHLISLPPQSATWLRASERGLAQRLVNRIRSLIART